jgi:hypothetical protein
VFVEFTTAHWVASSGFDFMSIFFPSAVLAGVADVNVVAVQPAIVAVVVVSFCLWALVVAAVIAVVGCVLTALQLGNDTVLFSQLLGERLVGCH